MTGDAWLTVLEVAYVPGVLLLLALLFVFALRGVRDRNV